MMTQDQSRSHSFVHAFVPSLADIIFVVVFMLALAYGSQMLSIDSDLGRHLTIGNYILDNHTIYLKFSSRLQTACSVWTE
jgi:hypothetical protein